MMQHLRSSRKRFGTKVDGMGVIEAMDKSRLNFHVDKLPIYTVGHDGTHYPVDTKKFMGTFRTDTMEALGIVSGGYNVLQNYSHIEPFMPEIESGHLIPSFFATLGGGRQVFFFFNTGSLYVAGKDEITKTIGVRGSHDGSSSILVWSDPSRVACTNALIASINRSIDSYWIKHTRNMNDKIEDAKHSLKSSDKYFLEFHRRCELLVAKPVNTSYVSQFVAKVLPAPVIEKSPLETDAEFNERKEKLMAKHDESKAGLKFRIDNGTGNEGFQGTAWALYNSYTEWIDWDRNYRSEESRFDYITFGDGAKKKSNVFNMLLGA